MIRVPQHRRRLRECIADERGVTVVEFALVAPVFILLLVGTLDIGQMVYAQSVLNGAVQTAARGASLEDGDTAAADQIVLDRVDGIMPGVEIDATRTSYYDFADIERPEQWNDEDDNNVCNDGESYVDENSNGQWDDDIGVSGNGGANDVVIYTVTATYEPLFKVPFTPESWATRTLESTAVKKNQPFANQEDYSSTAGTCS
ncbi:TadE/TadG family type IV pilus assembly protein [Aurantiacibacter poecillastricola]|uniref:TadE/TadG family type IV pilus assembly protein n=1 Tax=Aurantiacibacter poecillastricola TaxID=3064385 RepID=UPI00273E0A4A|nr:TadE/TadG family type IV pilus assembly protein [Aurantiacibacter sp. 219JJ12-13]MDP5260624.1 TadE/TadG family type IV pilus assembly protein [Aurantiacibacter sp. 219JJ12-13]